MFHPLRIEYPGAYYHVMNRGLARGKIFLKDADRERFLELVGEVCRLWVRASKGTSCYYVDGDKGIAWTAIQIYGFEQQQT